MSFDNLLRAFVERPVYQRLFLAFTLGLFISCGAKMAGATPPPPPDASVSVAAR